MTAVPPGSSQSIGTSARRAVGHQLVPLRAVHRADPAHPAAVDERRDLLPPVPDVRVVLVGARADEVLRPVVRADRTGQHQVAPGPVGEPGGDVPAPCTG